MTRRRVMALAVLGPAAVAAAIDVSGLGERRLRAIQMAAFAPLVTAPAVAVAAVAAVAGWPVVALAAAPLAVWRATLRRSTAAEAANRRTADQVGAGPAVAVRVATVNLRRSDGPVPATVGRLAAFEPDLVLVQELTPGSQPSFAGGPFGERFPHRFEAPEDGFFGSGLYSRFPILTGENRCLGGRHMAVAAVDVAGQPVTVVAVHTQAPIYRRDIEPWRSGFADLGALAADAAGPLILAGDWNATTGNRPFRRMLRARRLVDAHLAVGRGGGRTWPGDRRLLPPLLLLDHVVVGGGVAVMAVSEHEVVGSDHLAVVADLRVATEPSR